MTDKYAVRSWIAEKIGEEHLIPLLGIYDSFDDIEFETLPDQFVIKCNHDSGSTTIVKDKSKIDKAKLRKKYEFFLHRNFAFDTHEMHYEYIQPYIIIEQLMIHEKNRELNDYKFLCFNGVPYYCWVDYDRSDNHKRNVYDLKWNLQPFNQYHYGNYHGLSDKPSTLEKMTEIAKIISQGFDHVRVDLYDIQGQIYFGEMTFTNGSGFEKITPDEWDLLLGKLWDLDLSNREKNNMIDKLKERAL